MTSLPSFKENKELTVGVELELQLVSLTNYNLSMEANDFLRRLYKSPYKDLIKPEITESMIEINSSIHSSYAGLKNELLDIRNIIVNESRKSHIGVCGGGTHPFQKWKDQRIFKTERFMSVAEQYGYLAKQFTVFGQHIHISCPNGDDALYLCHALAYYVPHFIALSASSPFSQGIDTSFDCSRLAIVSAFPLSGMPPWFFKWEDFRGHFERLKELEVISSMKDFYWDIRPKPEYGTVEIRVCDTPLTVERAADLAYYAYNLVNWLLNERPCIKQDIYLTYAVNRFYATRFGFNCDIIEPTSQTKRPLAEDIFSTCNTLEKYALKSNSTQALKRIKEMVLSQDNDAKWLREKYSSYESFSDIVQSQVELWKSAG